MVELKEMFLVIPITGFIYFYFRLAYTTTDLVTTGRRIPSLGGSHTEELEDQVRTGGVGRL
jgi:hypothetical protein